jgi:hypothetical protein
MQMHIEVPVDSLLAVNGMADRRKLNKGKVGRKMVEVVSGYDLRPGVDKYVPGVPYTVARSLRDKVPLKPLKVPGVCVFAGCTNKCHKRGKWCEAHFPVIRAISMKANHTKFRNQRRRRKGHDDA